MKNLIKRIAGCIKKSWFWNLKWWRKVTVLYFTLSFCLTCSFVAGPWWGAFLITGNFGLSAFLLRYVPVNDEE